MNQLAVSDMTSTVYRSDQCVDPDLGPGLFKACKQGFVKCFQDLLERYENFTRWILELDTQ